MIVKTIRWKIRGWKRLVEYIDGEKSPDPRSDFAIYHNIADTSQEGVIRAFEENDRYRKLRKNGVVVYHEVLSFHLDDRDKITQEIGEDISRKYIELRADGAIVYARPHWSNGNFHIHFAISGTEYKSQKTMRMDDRTFKRLRLDIERYQVENYPELVHSIVYLNKKERRKDQKRADENTRHQREFQMKRRTGGRAAEKDQAIKDVRECLKQSKNFDDFHAALTTSGMELYIYHGAITGIRFGKRKYRFSTLGLDKQIMHELASRGQDEALYKDRINQLKILQSSGAKPQQRSR